MSINLSSVRRPPLRAAGGGRQRLRASTAALLGPFFVLFTFVTLVPIGYAVYLSVMRTQRSGLGFGPATTFFDGLGNYARLLADSDFRGGFLNVAVYGLVFVPVMLAAALLLAMLLDSALAKVSRFFQLVYFLPHVVPGILAALIWLYLYTPGVSPVFGWLSSVGLNADLSHEAWFLPAIANVGVWEATGYNIVIFYAALKAIPKEVTEAALVDGASELRTAWSIKLPLIGPAACLAGLMTLVGVLQLFNEPLVLRTVAPGSITSTWTPNLDIYNEAFQNQDFSTAAAGSVLLAILSGVLSFVVIRATRKWRSV